MHIGLYFGSFNPIHFGHLMVARYILNFENIDQVWFVVSRQNPFKKIEDLAPENDRLEMTKLAINGYNSLKASDIELHLPAPSYTINTLEHLRRTYNDYTFSIIMGADNLEKIHDWYRADDVLKYPILAYPRKGYNVDNERFDNVKIVTAPQVEISSTMLRNWLKQGKSIENYTPTAVIEYIESKNLYL